MGNAFRFPFPLKKDELSVKKSALLQIIFVLSSSILSSTAVATALKAWLENRRTKLTIRIDDKGKMLTYEGHHLNQDVPTIHALVEKLSQPSDVVIHVDTVISPLRDDRPEEVGKRKQLLHRLHMRHNREDRAEINSKQQEEKLS